MWRIYANIYNPDSSPTSRLRMIYVNLLKVIVYTLRFGMRYKVLIVNKYNSLSETVSFFYYYFKHFAKLESVSPVRR